MISSYDVWSCIRFLWIIIPSPRAVTGWCCKIHIRVQTPMDLTLLRVMWTTNYWSADPKISRAGPLHVCIYIYIYKFAIISWKSRAHKYTKVYFLSFDEIPFRKLTTQRECRYVISSRILNGHGSNMETWESAITNIPILCNKLQVRVKLLHFIVTAWPWTIAIEAARYREDIGIRASCCTLKINSLRFRRNHGNTFELGICCVRILSPSW